MTPPHFEERAFQTQAIADLRATGMDPVILYAPTGAGKTAVMCRITSLAVAKGRSVLFMCDSGEILDQTSETMGWWGVEHGIIRAQDTRRKPGEAVHIGTIQTLRNRVLPKKSIVFVDECHLARAASWEKVIQSYIDSGAKIIGATATPCRLDGRGLGKLFKHIVCCPSIAELTEQGYLVPFTIMAPPAPDTSKVHTTAGDFKKDEIAAIMDKSKLIGDAVEHYGKMANGRLAILAATSIKHSQHLAEAFRAAGIPAAHCDGETHPDERKRILKSLPAREIMVLCQVDICGKGWDCPQVSVVIDCRPTKSLARWLQFVGRGIRPSLGKENCRLHDHSGNFLRFGWPDTPREWTLDETASKKQPQERALGVRICKACWCCFRATEQKCPQCGAEYHATEREIRHEAGDLREVLPPTRCDRCELESESAKIGSTCERCFVGTMKRKYVVQKLSKNPLVAAVQKEAEEKGWDGRRVHFEVMRRLGKLRRKA